MDNIDYFSGYEKIPQDFRKFDEQTLNQLNKLPWVVTEKVHGANFSFIYEHKKLKFAKRKGYLQWSDDFFGFQIVVNALESQIISLFEELSLNIIADRYIIYGELFGGSYPHTEVISDVFFQPIQTGVYYSPNIHFYAFDIAIETNEGIKYYLNYKQVIDYFEKYQLIYAKPLFIGKLNEALNFNTRFNSTLPAVFDLPELEHNLVEGVVVKPFTHLSKFENNFRPIIKIKNTEFDEQEKFHQAAKWSYIPDVSSNSEELGFLIEELRKHITVNRLNSAISKVGALNAHNQQRLIEIEQEFLKDIIADFNEENNDVLADLQDFQRKWIEDRVHAELKLLIVKLYPQNTIV